MDVTANNIANVNTVGYKYGRVTFEEATAQLLKGSTRPTENKGGTNPLQIGLGMQIGSIDMILNQGNLQSTGIITDLAIEGRAFFAYSDGDAMFYSRNGALQMDASGRLVAPTNGFALQGMMANSDGTYPPGTPIDDISVPYGEKAPANATSEISYSSNLDSDSEGLGTVLHTNRFLAVGASTDLLTAMYDANGNDIGIRAGDILTFSCIDGNNPGTTLTSTPFSVTSTTTYSDLESALEVFLNANIPGAAGSADMSINATTGALQLDLSGIPAGNAVINNLTVRNDRPTSDPYVSNLFNWGPTVSSPTVQPSTGSVRAPVTTTDLVANIFDASGNALGFEDDGGMNDVITINGAIGGNPITPYTLTYSSATTTVGDLLTALQAAFNLPDTDGTYANNPSVAINQEGTGGDARIPAGSIVVRGQPQLAFALSNVSANANNADNDNTAPLRFVANMIMTEVQSARNIGTHSTSITVYDESGDSHVLTTTFTHSGRPGEWLWEVLVGGNEQIIGGNTGNINFGQDGSVSAFTFDDGSTAFAFDPMNGSNVVSVRLLVGGPGDFTGITQFRSPTTTAAREQDGYAMGKLSEISIDEFGDIIGMFTNGVNKSLARIFVAEFNNPAGLTKVGDSMYTRSNNSGEGTLLRPGIATAAKIKPGTLEMSNVELAAEFTKLITTQRGYQANARVITTSDEMLQELVQLIR
jgi:flagellar hook protein FlgE